ncbi:MAG: IgGFc-binding protein [Myxococcales bacterium]|nr:IgGFc-binding protein [Myxococcales bacterium]
MKLTTKGWFSQRPMTRWGLAAVVGFTFAAACIGACSADRGGFVPDTHSTFPEASVEEDGPVCHHQCSLDGRSVIDDCTGRVVETCAETLACGAGECQEQCAAAAADRSSNGCNFYFQMPRMSKKYPHGCNAAFVVNTSTQPVDMTLERDGRQIDISKSVFRTIPGSAKLVSHAGAIPPGESVVLFLSDSPPGFVGKDYIPCPDGVTPATTDDPVPGRTGFGSSFRLSTDMPVALTSMYPFGGAKSYYPTATLVLPVATWGKEHVIVNGWAASTAGFPAVQIVASEDDTEVTILPNKDIQDGSEVVGSLAHERAKYRLSRGQFLQIVQPEELSGSMVTSDKPTTLFGGNSCAFIPSSAPWCDILWQQIPPFAQWGSEYVGVGYRPRAGNEHEPVPYRLVAARDGTRLEYEPDIPPGAPTTMKAGEVAEFRYGTGDAFVVRTQDAEHPIYVSAHMTGSAGAGGNDSVGAPNYMGAGDAEFVNVVPTAQYLNSYSFYADPSFAETSLTIVRRQTSGAFKDVWLECAGKLTRWKPVGARGEYEYTRVDLSRGGKPGDTFGEGDEATVCRTGLQRMRSEGPFTATVWGWDKDASYAYPGGTALRKLVETPLAPVN